MTKVPDKPKRHEPVCGVPITLRYQCPGVYDYSNGEESKGIQVDLNKLDPTIRVLRFVAID